MFYINKTFITIKLLTGSKLVLIRADGSSPTASATDNRPSIAFKSTSKNNKLCFGYNLSYKENDLKQF